MSKFVDEVAAEITLGTAISLDVADIVDSNVTEFNKYQKAVDKILDSGRVKGKQEASDYVLRELSKEYKDACTVIDKLSSKFTTVLKYSSRAGNILKNTSNLYSI